jgi:hypothetical protein
MSFEEVATVIRGGYCGELQGGHQRERDPKTVPERSVDGLEPLSRDDWNHSSTPERFQQLPPREHVHFGSWLKPLHADDPAQFFVGVNHLTPAC